MSDQHPDAAVQLAKRVKVMRDAQKQYFKSRQSAALDFARECERVVDAELKKILDGPQARPLFDDEPPAEGGGR